MKKIGFLKYLVGTLLLVAIMLSSGAMLSVGAEEQITVADFGIPNSERNTTVSGSELLALLAKIEISQAESNYIDGNGLFRFEYSEAVPTSQISTSLDSNGLHITLSNWEYTASNGKTVIWKPCSVTVNGDKRKVSGAGECLYEGAWADTEQFEISAEYECEFSISSELYNSLINYAYNEAVELNKRLELYEEQKTEYDASVLAYETYLLELAKYNVALEEYNEYLAAAGEYKEKWAIYEQYLAKLDEYNSKKEAYEDYLEALENYEEEKTKYNDYKKELNRYDTKLLDYQAYLNSVKIRTSRFEVMEKMFVTDSAGRSMYQTIMGSTVDSVLANKATIVDMAQVPEEAVDLAGQCTENLRSLLKEYKNLKTDKEKYLFYEQHYDELCKNYADLYETLKVFYDNKLVYAKLASEGKIHRYCQFLAQLYVTTTALDDKLARDDNWKMKVQTGDNYLYVEDYLEECLIAQDNDKSKPIYTGWPDEVVKPKEPVEVAKPTMPVEVAKPGNAPTEVKRPDGFNEQKRPEKPDEVSRPEAAPTPIILTVNEKALLAELRENKLVERDETSEDISVLKTVTVSKTVKDPNACHVVFHNGDDIIEYDIKNGATLTLPTNAPSKAEDAEFTYSFKEWIDGDGNTVVIDAVSSDLDFYASFTPSKKSYKVTWSVNGTESSENVEYGAIPEFDGATDKPMTESTVYTFIGWDHRPDRVTGDVTYTAQYAESARAYEVTWKVNGVTTTESCRYGDIPEYIGRTYKNNDGTYAYIFDGWSTEIKAVTGDVTYEAKYIQKALVLDREENTASVVVENMCYIATVNDNILNIEALYDEALRKEYGITLVSDDYKLEIGSLLISEMSERGIAKVEVSVTENSIRVIFLDKQGKEIKGGTPITLEFTYPAANASNIYFVIDDTTEALKIENGKATVRIASGVSAKIAHMYNATVVPSDHGEISLSATNIEAGTEVKVTQNRIESGYAVKEIKVTDADGNIIAFDAEKMSFIMPSSDVKVEAVYEKQTFKITFIADGKVISEKTYALGEEVEIPEDPTKESANGVKYTFTGWTPEVVIVKGDAEYVAVFTETKLADEDAMNNNNFKNKGCKSAFGIGVIAIAVVAVGALALRKKED